MKIAVGADHAGYRLKQQVKQHLVALGHEVVDMGTDGDESVDYPDYARGVSELVGSGECERGILVCGSGVGMAIAANKVAGVRAAACYSTDLASLSRKHNDSNVLALGERLTDGKAALKIVDTWLTTEFEGGRHERRVDKISSMDRASRIR